MAPHPQENVSGPGAPNDPATGFAVAPSETTLSDPILTLRKRKRILIAAALLGLLYGIYRSVTQPRLFEAYARIEVRSGSSNEYKVSATALGSDPQTRILNEVAILQSDTLLLTVARELNLPNHRDFLPANRRSAQASIDNPLVRQTTIERLQKNLRVVLVPKTEIVRISYTSPSPQLSADIVNRLVVDYIQRSYETRFSSTQRVSQWLSSQLGDLKAQVERSQEQVIALQKRLGVLGFDEKDNGITTSLVDLTRAAGSARIARIVAESRYRVLSGTDPTTVDGIIETTPGTAPGEFYALRSQIAAAKSNYAQLMTTYGPNHPLAKTQASQLAELEKQLNEEQTRLLTQARQNLLAAKASEDQTNAVLEQQKNAAYALKNDLLAYTIKARELESNRSLYEGLLNRLRTAGVQAGLEALEIDVVDQALIPATPRLQPYSTILLTTEAFALILGIALAFVLESLDTGLRNIAEIESVIQLPSLAIIPKARRAPAGPGTKRTIAQRNMGVLLHPKSQFAEAFRALRTSLLLSTAGHPPRIILFTSATPSEGKTTAACNLACTLAQGDARVLLLDADLRRPNIHHRFGLPGKVGLSTLLAASTTLPESLQHLPEIPNLDILGSGPIPPFPTEMLSSAAMLTLLQQCGELYTHIVIDSPPILSVTDGVILARHAEAVVLVVRHGKSGKHVVRRARDLLIRSGALITGLVLNGVDLNSPEYYGYYGYTGYPYTATDAGSWDPQA